MPKRPPDRLWILGFTLAALLLYSLNLGGAPLRDWDEGTVAQVAREIARAPDWQGWIYPQLWDVPYPNKPPLVHWLIALAFRTWGVTEWTARLPGALLTALSVPLCYGVARNLFPTIAPAVWSTAVYLTLMPVVRHGRLAMLDGSILCFFLGMLFCTLRARQNPLWSLGIGLGFAAICLTKSILGVLLLGIALLFLAWDTPRLLQSPYLWLGISLGAIPVGGWYFAQTLHRGSSFVQHSLMNQSLERVWTPVEGNQGPPWYYLWEILKSAWPWLWFWPWGLQMAWRDRRLSWGKLILTWSGLYFVIVSLMGTKLPWYIQPLYPVLALALGPVLAKAWQRGGGLSPRPYSPGSYPLAWQVGQALLLIAALGGGIYLSILAPQPTLDFLPTLLIVGGTSGLCWRLLNQRRSQFASVLVWGWYIALLALILSPQWSWEVNEHYDVRPIAALVRTLPPGPTPVYTTDPIGRPSLNFYSDRQVIPYCETNPKPKLPFYLLLSPPPQKPSRASLHLPGQVEGWQLLDIQTDSQITGLCEPPKTDP